MKLRLVVCLGVVALLSSVPGWADITVFTGYHDGLRAGGFFPNPWIGDTFNGQPILVPGGLGGGTDDGAILFVNGSTSVTISSVVVDGFGNGASFNLWPSFTLAPFQAAILTATAGDNFDTSDQPIQCSPSSATPNVHITIGLTTSTLVDTGQRLNTGGTDIAVCGGNARFVGPNESIGWAVIGDANAGQGNQIPEPASLVLFGTGLLGLGTKAWKRFIG